MFNNDTYIYALVDPRTGEIKYIGATTAGIERYKRHNSNYYLKKSTLKNNWIKSLKLKNLSPELLIIEHCNKEDLCELEEFYISYFKFLGFVLLNHCDRGYGIKPQIKSTEEKKRNASLKFTKHPIINLETKEIFDCVYDVLQKYPILVYSSLRNALQRPHESPAVRDLYFSYLTEGMNIEEELKKRMERRKNHLATNTHRMRKIREVSTQRIFNSLRDACDEYNLDSGDLSRHLQGKMPGPKGYTFEYVRD
jgi:hypothetical protein